MTETGGKPTLVPCPKRWQKWDGSDGGPCPACLNDVGGEAVCEDHGVVGRFSPPITPTSREQTQRSTMATARRSRTPVARTTAPAAGNGEDGEYTAIYVGMRLTASGPRSDGTTMPPSSERR